MQSDGQERKRLRGDRVSTVFRDYFSTFDEAKKMACSDPRAYALMRESTGADMKDFESVYKYEIAGLNPQTQTFAIERMKSELAWYRDKRPYFNVYPLIEEKFFELSYEIDLKELVMPFRAIEVRTQTRTILLCDKRSSFLLVVEGPNRSFQEVVIPRLTKINRVIESGCCMIDEPWPHKTNEQVVSPDEMRRCLLLAVGVCMLASDPSVIKPVILNRHRKESMTPAEIAMYADKAIRRTGRVGFEVGKDIERMKATMHYRNGCFAKYYVSKAHELYPKNAEASKVPIIKWRCGSVVNKDNVPRVPTGFKDLTHACTEVVG